MFFRIYFAVFLTFGVAANGFCSDSEVIGFSDSPRDIIQKCENSIKKTQAKVQKIAENQYEPSFKNTILALESTLADFDFEVVNSAILRDVSPNQLVRKSSEECSLKAKNYSVEVYSDQNLFERFKKFKSSKQAARLKGEDSKLLEDHYSMFLLSGLEVEDIAKRKRIKELIQEISQLEIEFRRNVTDGVRLIQLSRSELAGMSEEWISKLKKTKTEKYLVTTRSPDYVPFMKNAKSSNARKRLSHQYHTRGGRRNIEIFEKTLRLRHELANLMGFKSHAERVLVQDGRMAESPGEIRTFLNNLIIDIEPYLEQDLNEMKKLKCKENRCANWRSIVLENWDWRYYLNQLKKKSADINPNLIKEYFPLEKVTSGMFQIYETIFSIRIEELKDQKAWHPSVQAYQVVDLGSKEVLGKFYLDLFPREGKYGHAAVWPLVKSRYLGGGKYQKPVAAMVANFPTPTADTPSLLTHGPRGDVRTYFHEFGHIMDCVLARTKYAIHGGSTTYAESRSGTPRDFVEAPSQMLENWVWDSSTLPMLSGHYKTGKKLPQSTVAKIISLKNVGNGYLNMRQLFYSSIDLNYHVSPPSDSTASWHNLWTQLLKHKLPATVYPNASMNHFMGGYDVGYYGYMWSKVFAQDMFTVFEESGSMNPRVGMMYRKQIIEPRGGRSVMTSVKSFLRRDPNQKAFLRSLGIESVAKKPVPQN